MATRDIAEDHVLQDMGYIPTMEDWLKHMNIEPWMTGKKKIKTQKTKAKIWEQQ